VIEMKHNFRIDSFECRDFGRALILACVIFVIFTTARAEAANSNDPHGLWLRPEGGVQFSFYDCDNGLLCAKVVAAKNEEDQAAIGTVILRGATQTGPNEWKGKLYNSEDGKTYDGFITVKKSELTLKGCLWGVLCSGETWKRVSVAPGAQTNHMRLAQRAQ
jgi:uncharacterized protein (DUF2147 family)